MRFEKWHALGNAYLLVEQPDAGEVTPERARRLCDVDTGIGSDGVLRCTAATVHMLRSGSGTPTARPPSSRGTGTRIAAAWLLRESGAAEVWTTESRLVRAAPEPTAERCARTSAS